MLAAEDLSGVIKRALAYTTRQKCPRGLCGASLYLGVLPLALSVLGLPQYPFSDYHPGQKPLAVLEPAGSTLGSTGSLL